MLVLRFEPRAASRWAKPPIRRTNIISSPHHTKRAAQRRREAAGARGAHRRQKGTHHLGCWSATRRPVNVGSASLGAWPLCGSLICGWVSVSVSVAGPGAGEFSCSAPLLGSLPPNGSYLSPRQDVARDWFPSAPVRSRPSENTPRTGTSRRVIG